jgi:glyoxylase-like metal-dependent hydrolase (beta-lactamase superfamily II)
LPAGKDHLIPLSWQPVPGASGAEVYPYLQKPDLLSSNSYLIRTPDVLILIDPGGLCDQAAQLFEVIAASQGDRDRQPFVLLTHAHVDHFAGMQSLPGSALPRAVVFMAQEAGAIALEHGDRGLTQAELFNLRIVPLHVEIPLLTHDRTGSPGAVEIRTPGGQICTLENTPFQAGQVVLSHEQLSFPSGHRLDLFHTPGHSPDSICIQVGRLLMIGDMVFAANPGVAGVVGWSQGSLIRSLSGIRALLAEGDITLVCPGHGRILPTPDAERMLEDVRIRVGSLENIARFDSERALQAARFAEDCMELVHELFTVMAGRLSYVSHVMDELEEPELAAETDRLISGDTIDELIEAFQAFAEEHHRGNIISTHLALKAGQVMSRLERALNGEALAQVINPTLVQRAGRLLADYSTLLRGFTPPSERSECDLVPLIRSVVTGHSDASRCDQALFSSTDDDRTFARILRMRIGTRPLLADVALSLRNLPDSLSAIIDQTHFSDLLTYLLEDLVGTGADTIRVEAERRDYAAILTVAGNLRPGALPRQPKTIRFLQGLCERAGASLSCGTEPGEQLFRISVARPARP